MSEKLGTEDLKKVVQLGLDIGEFVEGVMKPDASDLVKAFEVVKEGVAAVKSLPLAIPQFLDLDSDEKEEMKKFISEQCDLENDKLEAVVEKAMSVVIDLSSLGSMFKKK